MCEKIVLIVILMIMHAYVPFYAKFADVQMLAEERKLSELECPLLVQLNWGKDDREGRFLLKREIDKTTAVRFQLNCYASTD